MEGRSGSSSVWLELRSGGRRVASCLSGFTEGAPPSMPFSSEIRRGLIVSSCCTQVPGSFTFSPRWMVDKGHLGTNRCQSFIHFLLVVKVGKVPPCGPLPHRPPLQTAQLTEAGWFLFLPPFLSLSFAGWFLTALANGGISQPLPRQQAEACTSNPQRGPLLFSASLSTHC